LVAEWAMVAHAADERFALIEANALQPIELPLEALGVEIGVKPAGLADADAGPVTRVVSGEALRPPSPAHLIGEWRNGALQVRWVRRSRAGWAWLDGTDAPLGEAVERYRVRISGNAGTLSLETDASLVTLMAEQLAAIGAGAAMISVTQMGDYAESRPASLQITV
jgi:hypothetical protein